MCCCCCWHSAADELCLRDVDASFPCLMVFVVVESVVGVEPLVVVRSVVVGMVVEGVVVR